MEIHERLCGCWRRVTQCFRKDDDAPPRAEKSASALVMENPGAKDAAAEPDAALRPLPPVPKVPKGAERDLHVALYDYSARTEEDISFSAGDTLEALDRSAGEWWYAEALNGRSAGRRGYIPANYVAAVESLDAEP